MDSLERQQLLRLPKAELHLHLEGSLSVETLWDISRRQGCPLGLTSLESCRQLYDFRDFAGFIRAIKLASQHLVAPQDYAEATRSLARQLESQGVVYAEVFISIGILLWRQVRIEPYLDALAQASADAFEDTGVRIAWLYDAVRQFGSEPFQRVIDAAVNRRLSNECVGIGIGGDETQVAAREFADGFARAREHGLRTTMHAGESCGAESVREVLRWLRPERIGHALHAADDPSLVDQIAQSGTFVDVCPISNFKTGSLAPSALHPAKYFYESSVSIAVSTDDPGIFNCTLLDQYAYLRDHNGFTAADLRNVVDGAWDCAFLSAADRRMMRLLPPLAAADPGGD